VSETRRDGQGQGQGRTERANILRTAIELKETLFEKSSPGFEFEMNRSKTKHHTCLAKVYRRGMLGSAGAAACM
jgi:hypothetical protein